MTSTAPHPPRDFRMTVLIVFAVVFLVNGLLIGWGFWLREQQPTVELSEPEISNLSTALCPGDTLSYKFRLATSQPAHVELKTSEQRLMVGERISFARVQEFTFLEASTLEVGRNWIVPSQYRQPVTGQDAPWMPGKYEQITVANVVGDSDVSEIKVPFQIKDSCE